MKETLSKVLALVRNELWETPLLCTITPADADDVLRVAHELNVGGMAANAIIRNHIPVGDDGAMRAWGIQQKHLRDNKAMNAELVVFTNFLEHRSLPYYIMKGQTYAALYPYPLTRSAGDIDFYCPPEAYQRAQQTIEEKLGINMVHNKSEIHDNFKIEGFEFEMHSGLTCLSYPKHQRYWDSLVASELSRSPYTIDINGKAIVALPPTLNVLYVFAHIMEHFVEKILMLKQLCDWAVLLHAYRDQIDRETLATHLSRLGLLKAYRAMGAWLVQELGLPEDDFPLALTSSDYRWVPRLSDDFLYWIERRRQMQKIKGPAASLRHSLRTAGIVARQSFRFFWLAPMEMLWRIPDMTIWSLRKRFSGV